MIKLIKFLSFVLMLTFLTSIQASMLTFLTLPQYSDKLYIDPEEFVFDGSPFRIHLGNNIWIETNHVTSDETGLYTHLENIISTRGEYKRMWKCPYCHHYWPIGTSCQNADCPSKY
jgi:hypothetical protein